MDYFLYIAVPALLGAAIFMALRAARKRRAWRDSMEREAAMESLGARRHELGREFLQAAAKSEKPRGLRWVGCELSGPPLFAQEEPSGRLAALVSVTVSFEAIPGGGMEEVEAVGNLRSATALFFFRDGAWTTDGRVIFNLEPGEALVRLAPALKALG